MLGKIPKPSSFKTRILYAAVALALFIAAFAFADQTPQTDSQITPPTRRELRYGPNTAPPKEYSSQMKPYVGTENLKCESWNWAPAKCCARGDYYGGGVFYWVTWWYSPPAKTVIVSEPVMTRADYNGNNVCRNGHGIMRDPTDVSCLVVNHGCRAYFNVETVHKASSEAVAWFTTTSLVSQCISNVIPWGKLTGIFMKKVFNYAM